jgi:hypothetical protein
LRRDIHTNEPRAIQRTALTPNAQKMGRMTLGPKTGAAIKLSNDADVGIRLTIGEGLETVLAGMVGWWYRPAWGVGDTGELAAFPVLSGITSLTIVVDNDTVEKGQRGQKAAGEWSQRWTSAGREVFRFVPRRPGADANDLLAEQQAEPHHDRPPPRANTKASSASPTLPWLALRCARKGDVQ